MPLTRLAFVTVLLVGAGTWLASCGATMPPPPDYSWEFDVTVEAAESDCAESVGPGDLETYHYGLVVEGDRVLVYSDDSMLAEGTLFGTYISYETPAPFTDHRTDAGGAPADVEWMLEGFVSFTDQNLSGSREGEEVITVVYSELPAIEEGCTHRSTTIWQKRSGPASE